MKHYPIIKAKVKASSLVEVIIALLIIMLVFAASTSVIVKIINARPNKADFWQQKLHVLAIEIKAGSACGYAEYDQEEGVTIYQYCEPYKPESPLSLLKLEAVYKDQILAHHEEIYFQKAD